MTRFTAFAATLALLAVGRAAGPDAPLALGKT
ncbi:MAG: hypothetical protein JWO38_1659, partial [Gemmataceae bacterium]|nr:hypothetical protein [Gemmataceae bacterium]MDB5307457.1 hypothetical protein [Gemmataceae bacterium]